jgi:DtxR family Mn-dependent transcriptional regulator
MSDFPDPAVALLAFAALALVAAAVFWPRRGVAAWLRRVAELSERVRLEDAVKHLFSAEAAGRPSSIDSLAGAAGLSRDRAVQVVRRLEAMQLARPAGGDIRLTEEGRAHALRIVRTHRIWERYLADETGLAPAEWHATADRLEHRPAEEVERLAASMGQPTYDPHGDPIPTAGGVLPPARGVPISSIPRGTSVRVVHVEDEPEGIYRALRAAGVNLGTRLRVDRVDQAGIHVVVEGRAVSLEPLAADNLTVEATDDDDVSEADVERLHVLRPGEEGVVVRIGGQVQGAQRRRLLDLGVVPGTVIRAELESLSGDPVAYRIRGAVVALRRAQADDILVRRRSRQEAA